MAIAHVQTLTAISATNSAAEPVAATTTPVGPMTVSAKSLLVLAFTSGDSTNTRTVTVSDGTNTWTQIGSYLRSASNQLFALFYAYNVAAGTITVTPTVSAAEGYRRAAVSEYSGVQWSSAPLDQVNSKADTVTTSTTDGDTSGSITPTISDALIYAALCEVQGGTLVHTNGTGFTQRASVAPTSGSLGTAQVEVEDLLQGPAASVQGTWTTTATTGHYSAFVASFRPDVISRARPTVVNTAINRSAFY